MKNLFYLSSDKVICHIEKQHYEHEHEHEDCFTQSMHVLYADTHNRVTINFDFIENLNEKKTISTLAELNTKIILRYLYRMRALLRSRSLTHSV